MWRWLWCATSTLSPTPGATELNASRYEPRLYVNSWPSTASSTRTFQKTNNFKSWFRCAFSLWMALYIDKVHGPTNGTPTWHPAMAPHHGTTPCPKVATTTPLLLEVRIAIALAIWGKNDKNWLKPAVSGCLVLLMADVCKIGRLFPWHKFGTVDGAWYYKNNRICAFSPNVTIKVAPLMVVQVANVHLVSKAGLEETHSDDQGRNGPFSHLTGCFILGWFWFWVYCHSPSHWSFDSPLSLMFGISSFDIRGMSGVEKSAMLTIPFGKLVAFDCFRLRLYDAKFTYISPNISLVPKMEVLTYISYVDTAYVRENPPPK